MNSLSLTILVLTSFGAAAHESSKFPTNKTAGTKASTNQPPSKAIVACRKDADCGRSHAVCLNSTGVARCTCAAGYVFHNGACAPKLVLTLSRRNNSSRIPDQKSLVSVGSLPTNGSLDPTPQGHVAPTTSTNHSDFRVTKEPIGIDPIPFKVGAVTYCPNMKAEDDPESIRSLTSVANRCFSGGICRSPEVSGHAAHCFCPRGLAGNHCQTKLTLTKVDRITKMQDATTKIDHRFVNHGRRDTSTLSRHLVNNIDECIARCLEASHYCKSLNFGDTQSPTKVCELIAIDTMKSQRISQWTQPANGWTHINF